MPSLNDQLNGELAQLRAANLFRELRDVTSAQGARIVVDGREFLNFSSNDYLGLANDPVVKQAATAAIDRWGVGAGASRLVCGNLAPYRGLEEKLARFKNKEAAIVFGSGYAANVGTITALVGAGDVVILDKLDHASIIDGARQSGATIRVYPHGNMRKLEELLVWAKTGRGGDAAPTTSPSDFNRVVGAASPPRPGRVLIITETAFSMDGNLAPLAEIVALKQKYDAWLMIDEAHATGLYAKNRRGLAEAAGVEEHIDVTLGTLSKAVGCAGGFVVGSQVLIDYLRNRARSLIYSTALPPAVCAAAAAAVDFIMSDAGQQRRDELWRNVSEVKIGLAALGIKNESRSPIIPIIIGDEQAALDLSGKLYEQGIFVPAIRYPTVPKGTARLRVTVSAAHREGDIREFLAVFERVYRAGRGGDAAPTTPSDKPSNINRVVGAASPPRPGGVRPHSGALRHGRVSLPGECYFLTACVAERRPVFQTTEAAREIISTLRWLRDQQRIRLLGFVVMPDHVHVALALCEGWTLDKVMHSLKSFTSHQLGRELGLAGTIWQAGYHDQGLRERRDFEKHLDYMHDNPRRAGLVRAAEEYPFSTAHPEFSGEIDWSWLEGETLESGRGGDAAPTTPVVNHPRAVGAVSPPRQVEL
ncbi:MAG: aminotransferase class I/II-fold pyridoxal phosphate-dependent enzyme [Verrucomicrobiota bacterium]